jgi:type II secretory pathway pseudopilin PulG
MALSNKKIFIYPKLKSKYKFLSEEGFSVMELIVATGIFSLLVLASFGIFSSVLRGQQRILAQTRLQREAQLVLETITRKIRTSRVDYAEYETIFGVGNPIINPVQELILIDQTDSQVRFTYNTTDETLDLQVDSGQVNSMSADDVSITSFDFFIEPTQDPFISGLVPSTQPRVIIVMTIQSSEGSNFVEATIQQTTPQRGSAY